MTVTTLEAAHAAELDVYFFTTEEHRAEFMATLAEVTGREVGVFDTTVAGFPLLCGTVARRRRPVVVAE